MQKPNDLCFQPPGMHVEHAVIGQNDVERAIGQRLRRSEVEAVAAYSLFEVVAELSDSYTEAMPTEPSSMSPVPPP